MGHAKQRLAHPRDGNWFQTIPMLVKNPNYHACFMGSGRRWVHGFSCSKTGLINRAQSATVWWLWDPTSAWGLDWKTMSGLGGVKPCICYCGVLDVVPVPHRARRLQSGWHMLVSVDWWWMWSLSQTGIGETAEWMTQALRFLLFSASFRGHYLCTWEHVVTYLGIWKLVINHNLLKHRLV